MNQILFKNHKPKYPAYGNYQELFIDGKPLDEYLDKLYPKRELKGLVSPFDGWLINKPDEDLLKERYLPDRGNYSILPILICPDDQDFSCSVVVTKVIVEGDLVKWKNFGFQKSNLDENGIEWFDQTHILSFDRKCYESELGKLLNNKVIGQ